MQKIKTLKEANLSYDFLFSKVMEDEKILTEVLSKIIGRSVRDICYVSTQKSIEEKFHTKGVRLDIYAKDENDNLYNVEIQNLNMDIPQRSRFYQEIMDMDFLKKGRPYSSLKDNYVIFICTFDLFGEGEYLYRFQTRCVGSDEIVLGDGCYRIFLNTRGTVGKINWNGTWNGEGNAEGNRPDKERICM